MSDVEGEMSRVQKAQAAKRKRRQHGQIFALAVEHGCKPEWYDGIFGERWHCSCEDELHCCDQQCSAITLESARRSR